MAVQRRLVGVCWGQEVEFMVGTGTMDVSGFPYVRVPRNYAVGIERFLNDY